MKRVFAVFIGMVFCCGYGGVFAQEPLEGLRVPVDFYPNGQVKTELQADRAEILPDGRIRAEGIEFRTFETNGTLDVTIRAADAIADRGEKEANSERPVSLMREALLLTGEGFVWNGKGETIRILRRVRLSFPSEMIREEGVWPGERIE